MPRLTRIIFAGSISLIGVCIVVGLALAMTVGSVRAGGSAAPRVAPPAPHFPYPLGCDQ